MFLNRLLHIFLFHFFHYYFSLSLSLQFHRAWLWAKKALWMWLSKYVCIVDCRRTVLAYMYWSSCAERHSISGNCIETRRRKRKHTQPMHFLGYSCAFALTWIHFVFFSVSFFSWKLKIGSFFFPSFVVLFLNYCCCFCIAFSAVNKRTSQFWKYQISLVIFTFKEQKN